MVICRASVIAHGPDVKWKRWYMHWEQNHINTKRQNCTEHNAYQPAPQFLFF
jgi:hypothetical protein